MSHTPLTSDDPRLTAYVLGELEAADRAAVETQLANDPQCREIVEQLQQTTASLFEALQSEPVPSLTDEQRAAITAAAQASARVVIDRREEPASPRRGALAVIGSAAVCLVVMATVSLRHFGGGEYAATDRNGLDNVELALLDRDQVTAESLSELEALGLERGYFYLSNGAAVTDEKVLRELREAINTTAELSAAERQIRLQMMDESRPASQESLQQRYDVLGLRIKRLADGEAIPGNSVAGNAPSTGKVPGNLGDVTDLSGGLAQPGSNVDGITMPLPGRAMGIWNTSNQPQAGQSLTPDQSGVADLQKLKDRVNETTEDLYDNLNRPAAVASSVQKVLAPTAPVDPAGIPSATDGTSQSFLFGGSAPHRSLGTDPLSGAARPTPSPVSESLEVQGNRSITTTAPAPATPTDKYYMGRNFQLEGDSGTNPTGGKQQTNGSWGYQEPQSGQAGGQPPVQNPAADGRGRPQVQFRYDAEKLSELQRSRGGARISGQQSGAAPAPTAESPAPHAPSSQGPLLNVPGRDQYGDGLVVGRVVPETFDADLDVPFRQGSFELGVPEFGAYKPDATDSKAPATPRLEELKQVESKRRDVSEHEGETIHGPLVTDPLGKSANLIAAGRPLAREGEWYYFDGAERPPIAGVVPVTRGKKQGWRVAASPLGWSSRHLGWIDGVEPQAPGTEAYAPIHENEFRAVDDQPLSTFGLDVDTASYANVRRFLMEAGRFPPPDAVRLEELVNYFTYSDREPADDEPLAVSLEAAACPWNTEHRLVRIGLKAKAMDLAERPPTTLVFLIDTSGSMRDEAKLPLVKQSLRLLVDEMTENDRIAIVTYNTDAGLLLDSTSGEQRVEIISAIDGLQAKGSTNGEEGLKVAYKVATRHFIEHGQNRVILCTDGDFNVGTSDTDPLVGMISEKRASGVFLSICGYGTGNIKDEKLERIADKGNGQYHYIDNLKEAHKVFLDELTGTLYTIAKDVKLQVEFNPASVASYRLLGYENRTMAAQDFNNDRVDSGDMGAGHSVTALYELVPAGTEPAKPASETPGVDPLKYQGSGVRSQETENDRLTATQRGARSDDSLSTLNPQPSTTDELLTVKLRYKQPNADESVKREFPLVDERQGSPSENLEWSPAVASFGMLLRGSQHAGQSSLEGILELAQGAKGRDESGRRREFIDMVLQTQSLARKVRGQSVPEPRELSSVEARRKATVGGKYQDLLDKLEMRADASRYGAFHDYGWSADQTYAGRAGLPAGYWVYVYPDWYIWGENVSADAK